MQNPSQVIRAVFPSHDSNSSDEWYTESHIMAGVRRVLGFIDLDPASCIEANKTVKANRFYTIEEDGLSKNWVAETVWLNSPRGMDGRHSIQAIWANRLIAHYRRGEVKEAMFIVRNCLGYLWFNALLDTCPNVCFLRERPAYYRGYMGVSSGQDQLTGVVFYLGANKKLFQQTFSHFGYTFDKNSYR